MYGDILSLLHSERCFLLSAEHTATHGAECARIPPADRHAPRARPHRTPVYRWPLLAFSLAFSLSLFFLLFFLCLFFSFLFFLFLFFLFLFLFLLFLLFFFLCLFFLLPLYLLILGLILFWLVFVFAFLLLLFFNSFFVLIIQSTSSSLRVGVKTKTTLICGYFIPKMSRLLTNQTNPKLSTSISYYSCHCHCYYWYWQKQWKNWMKKIKLDIYYSN